MQLYRSRRATREHPDPTVVGSSVKTTERESVKRGTHTHTHTKKAFDRRTRQFSVFDLSSRDRWCALSNEAAVSPLYQTMFSQEVKYKLDVYGARDT